MNVYPEGGMNFDWDMTYIVDGEEAVPSGQCYSNLSHFSLGMTTVEHSIPIPTLYDDVLTLFSASGTGNTPTHIVNYGGIFGEDYVWVCFVGFDGKLMTFRLTRPWQAHESVPFDEKYCSYSSQQ